MDGRTDRQAGGETDGETDEQTDREGDGETDGQTVRYIDIFTVVKGVLL